MQFILREAKVRVNEKQYQELLNEPSTTVRVLASLIDKISASSSEATVLTAPLCLPLVAVPEEQVIPQSAGVANFCSSNHPRQRASGTTGPRLVGTCLSSWKGQPATATALDRVIQSDASNGGCGACCGEIRMGGQ